jgi:hypothetical protein
MGESKWLVPKRKKTKFRDHYCTLFNVATFQKQICTASFCSFVHIHLLFGQQHLLSRTVEYSESGPNCNGTTWGVDGWMDEWWMDGSTLLSTQLRFIHNWVRKGFQSVGDWPGFCSLQLIHIKVPSIETHLGFIHPKIHPFAPEMLWNEVIQFHGPNTLIISGTYQGFFFEVLT